MGNVLSNQLQKLWVNRHGAYAYLLSDYEITIVKYFYDNHKVYQFTIAKSQALVFTITRS